MRDVNLAMCATHWILQGDEKRPRGVKEAREGDYTAFQYHGPIVIVK